MGATDDIVTLAENKLDAILNSEGDDKGNGNGSDNADDQEQKNNNSDEGSEEKGGSDESQDDDGQEDESGEEGEGEKSETEDESGEDGDDEKSGKKDDETQELSDEQFLAELEKRGLKVVEKDKEEKKEEEKQQEIVKPEELPDKVWGKMNDVQKYIYNELPYIKVQGKDGVVEVKTPDQLPDDFEFANAQAQAKFIADISAQSTKAEKLHSDIMTYSQQQEKAHNTQIESKQIVDDVEQLQREGIIPKIVAKNGTPEFNKDPGVVRANEILALREERRAKGEVLSAYSAGLMYKALHPELYKPVESKGDQERKNVSSKISGGGKGDQKQASKNTTSRHKYPIGMSAQDIADLAGADLD